MPLPITISEDIKNQWHTTGLSGDNINEASGLGITVSCEDIEGALSFINGLLDQEVLDLRSWGVEGVDYNVDENGVYYRTDEQRAQVADTAYKASHLCGYSYFPGYGGESFDGINAMKPEEQPQEFLDSLPDKVAACLEAYGCSNYVDMLGNNEIPGIWYPMYSYSNNMTTATPGGMALDQDGRDQAPVAAAGRHGRRL